MSPKAYETRVRALGFEGMTRSDAQTVADAEILKLDRIPKNCLPNSAWRMWQMAGYEWALYNPGASDALKQDAAAAFAAIKPWAVTSSVTTAFLEGVNA